MPTAEPAIVFTPLLTTLLAIELSLLLFGCVILIRGIRGAPARFLGLGPAGLGPSPLRPSELFLAAAFAFGGAIILQVAATQIAERYIPKSEGSGLGLREILQGAGFQLGLLAGIGHAWFWHLRPERRAPDRVSSTPPAAQPPDVRRISLSAALKEGACTFLTLLPIVWLTGFLWQNALDLFGVDAKPQDLVTLFAQTGDRVALGVMITLAVLVAPVTEEIVFRIGLFRWLRTRTLRGIALFVPAVAFAGMHGNVAVFAPLVVLAICLALAYERTGHPLVPVVAHSLFNLNTVVLLLAGLPT